MVKHNRLPHLVTEAPRGPRQIVRPSPCNQIHRAHIDQLANQMSERNGQSHQWLQEIYCRNPSSSQLMCLVWNLVTWLNTPSWPPNRFCLYTIFQSEQQSISMNTKQWTNTLCTSLCLAKQSCEESRGCRANDNPELRGLGVVQVQDHQLRLRVTCQYASCLGHTNQSNWALNIVCLGFLSQHSKLDKQQPGSPKTGMIENHRKPMIAGSPYYRGTNCAACELTL